MSASIKKNRTCDLMKNKHLFIFSCVHLIGLAKPKGTCDSLSFVNFPTFQLQRSHLKRQNSHFHNEGIFQTKMPLRWIWYVKESCRHWVQTLVQMWSAFPTCSSAQIYQRAGGPVPLRYLFLKYLFFILQERLFFCNTSSLIQKKVLILVSGHTRSLISLVFRQTKMHN